ncbi:hypothetical protein VKT23_014101 [Stygiomarasmius scandens]|uniref:Uncharacterized protein n=1 Tax=Marasmiellus scandens TaxID=2682957 RepID=A0ABR1J429_9AGAR
MSESDINSFLAELSQLGSANSSALTSYVYITVGLISMLPIIMLFRLRYPCVTVSGLEDLVNGLKEGIETCRKEEVPTVDFEPQFRRISRQLSDIKIDNNKLIFRWSTAHVYIISLFKILRTVIICYEEAQALQISILVRMFPTK